MSKLTLVIADQNYSSWSLRAWLVMKQAGLDFTEVKIFLKTPETNSNILHYSPSGKLPVLLHGTLKIWESLAICEYIAEQFAPSLWPEDPQIRAVARSVCSEMHAGFIQLRENMPMNCWGSYPGEGMTPLVQNEIDRIFQIWQECRQNYSNGGDWLFGNFTIADAMFAPVVSRFITYNVKLDSTAQDYVHKVWALPAMQEWLHAAKLEIQS